MGFATGTIFSSVQHSCHVLLEGTLERSTVSSKADLGPAFKAVWRLKKMVDQEIARLDQVALSAEPPHFSCCIGIGHLRGVWPCMASGPV